MRLATVRTPSGGRAAVRFEDPRGPLWVDVARAAEILLKDEACPATLKGLLVRDGAALETPRAVMKALNGARVPDGVRFWFESDAELDAPVPDPGAFLDFYAFEGHVRTARSRRNLDVPPEWYRYPVYYRSNQRAFQGHGETIWFPAGESMMDYELELAAVLGDRLESPDEDAAQAAVAGYTLLNDWSARAVQREVMKVGLGPNKGKDFATSLGPWLVTPDELGDLSAVRLAARVNGETWSDGLFGDIRWSWGEMLAFAGEGVRFEPGDVFGSGTASGGCGLELGRFLEPGDRVELDGGPVLGVLAGTVRRREKRK
jgi:fumarylacetoacetate (FAA) hydrolase